MDKLKILYVDDSPTQLNQFKSSLEDGPYVVYTATSGSIALQRMADVDLVVIDYNMPDMNGAECLKLLQQHAPEKRTIRYFLYTTNFELVRQHRDMGFDGVLLLKGKNDVRRQVDALHRSLTRRSLGAA